jgi:hypothetical protein
MFITKIQVVVSVADIDGIVDYLYLKRHYIVKILLKLALISINQSINQSLFNLKNITISRT